MRRRLVLTQMFHPHDHITCSAAEIAITNVNEEREPKTVQTLIDILPGAIQTHVATCHANYPCLCLASALIEATQCQPIT